MIILGLSAVISASDFTVSANGFGALLILVGVFLATLIWQTDKIVKLRRSVPAPPPPLEESRKVPTNTKKEIIRLLKIKKLSPPPSPISDVSDWAKFTVAFMTGIGKLWGELKLLIVGSVLLYLFLFARAEWFTELVQYDYGTTQTFQLVVLFFSALAFYRWITNNARWEPKPLSGGRWVAFIIVGVAVCLTVVIVFAIVHMTQLIQLLRFFGVKGA